MTGKKKGALAVLAAAILAALALVVMKTGLFPLSGSGKGDEVRTTQTRDSRKSEKKLKELIFIENMEIRETKYGLLELSGTGRFPDFSVYFEEHNEEAAETGDEREYEKLLFALTAEDLTGEEKASDSYVTRELTINLSVVDVHRGKDEWKEQELKELLRQAAFDSELEEFALNLVGDYLSGSTDWEAEKAIRSEDAGGEGEVETS